MQKISAFILAYLLSLVLFLQVTVIILCHTFFSPDYHIRQLASSGFAETAAAELVEEYTSFAASSGLDASVLTAGLNSSVVQAATTAFIYALFENETAYDYERYEDDLYNALTLHAQEKGYLAGEEIEEGLRDLASLCAETLRTHTASYLHERAVPYLVKYQKALTLTGIGLALLSLVFIAALVLPERKQPASPLLHISCSFLACLVSCVLVVVLYHLSGLSEGLSISPLSFKLLFSGLLNGFISVFTLALIPLLLLSALCLVLCRHFRRKTGSS